MGLLYVKRLLEAGEKVVATLRKPQMIASLGEKYGKDRLLVLQLDVTKKADVAAAFKKAKEHFGRIDAVFNNAGVPLVGEVEGTTEAKARSVFEVCNCGGAALPQA